MKDAFSMGIKKGKSAITGIVLLFVGSLSHAQTYSLRQILDSIDVKNQGLQQYVLKTQASYAQGTAASAWMAPMAGVGLAEFPYPSGNKIDDGMMPRKMLMLRLGQMFPNFSQQRKEEAYDRSYVSQNQDDRATMKNMLFAKAKMAYYDAFTAQKKLAILREQEQQLELLIKISEGRLAYNKADLPSIYKARARLSDLKSMRINLQSMTDQAGAILNSLMDLPVDHPLQIDTTVDFKQSQVAILQVDSAYLQANRSDIKHTKDEIHSMELKQDVTSAMAKPSFGITWDNMRMNGGMYMYSAMASVSIPIAPWFSKGYKSKITAIDYQIQAMQKMKGNQVSEALGNIRKDWLKLRSARQGLQIFQQDVLPAYAKTYQANLNAFSENTGDIYQTLMAWNDLTMKKMEYYDKLSELLNLQVMLETEMQQY